MPLPTATQIEAAGLKAWPSLETKRDGSWVLRAANGYTKRANSVQSMALIDDEDAPARLMAAAAWFKERGLPGIFRVTPLTGKKTLAALREAKWEAFDESVVLGMEMMRAPPVDARVQALNIGDPAFIAAQKQIHGYDDATAGKLSAILWTLNVPAAGIVLTIYDRPVSSALIAVADGIAIAGNVITAAADRGSGFGKATMNSGLAWAFGQGARVAALNMQADNGAASRLYQSLGYRHLYDYEYRKAPA